MKKTILIDGNNLLHRANFVFVKNLNANAMTNNSGFPTGLIYGVLSMLFSWIQDIPNPSNCVFFLDGIPKRRRAMDPNYKSNIKSELPLGSSIIRLSDSYEAKNEIDAITHILQLLNVPSCYHIDEEADDLIASYCNLYPDNIHVIISSDKDFYQLVSNKVILYRPGIKGNRFFDTERVLADEKYGIHPNHVRMFKTLTGDSSDGIVGIPRIRHSVARKLSEINSVEELKDLSICSPKEKYNILCSLDKLKTNYQLVGLFNNLPVESYIYKTNPDVDIAIKIIYDDFNISGISDIQIRNFYKHINASGFIKIGIVPESLPDTNVNLDNLLSQI